MSGSSGTSSGARAPSSKQHAESERERVRQLSRARLFGDAFPVTAERYELREYLGRGGLGVVYRALDLRLRRDVAVKFARLLRHRGGDERQLYHEALLLARLSHPNIVPVYDVGIWEGEIFIAMELVDGVTLEHILGSGPRSWRDVAGWFRQIANALAAAHKAGVIHGDIKPSNVMLGNDDRVRVLDFGLARELIGPSEDQQRDSTTQPSGTAGYLAPECYSGGLTAASDQFSFCVMLYQTLFGVLPFGPKRAALGRAELALVAPPRTPVGAKVPAWLFAIVRRGVAFDPSERFPDMSAIAEALSRPPKSGYGVTALAVVLALGVSAALRGEGDRCLPDPNAFRGIWDPPRRADLLLRAPAHEGAAAVTGLDAYEEAWAELAAESCSAFVADRISPVLHDLRSACLQRSRRGVELLLQRVAKPEFDAWPLLEGAIDEMTHLAPCRDDGALLDARTVDEGDAELADAIGRGIDSAYVQLLFGDPQAYLDELLEVERKHADIARAPHATVWLAAHLASALNQLGRHREALDRARKGLLAAGRFQRWRDAEGNLHVHLAEALASRGTALDEALFHADQAIAIFEGDERLHPFLDNAYRARAVALLAGGRAEDALVAVADARRGAPSPTVAGYESFSQRLALAGVENLRGLALEQLGRAAEAEAAYRDALASARNISRPTLVAAQIHNNLGVLLGTQGRTEQAESELTRAAELKIGLGQHDGAATTWMNIGNLRLRAKHPDQAIAAFGRALVQSPSGSVQAKIRYNRALALREQGQQLAALDDLDFVIETGARESLDPRYVHGARVVRGMIFLERGDKRARAELESAHADTPGGTGPSTRAELLIGLARALGPEQEARAKALARESLGLAETAGEAELAADARRWLAAHPGG